MFDVPFRLPRQTIYHEIGVDPDASDEEVRWAMSERVRQLEAKQRALVRELDKLTAQVDGLDAAIRTMATLHRSAIPVDRLEAARTQLELSRLEQVALTRDPEYRRKRERVEAIEGQIHALHRSALDKPEERLAYDRAHPPLALLRLTQDTSTGFAGAASLRQLRKELSDFLAHRGEEVFHPSDLTRQDFSADFAFNPIVDEGSDARPD